MNDNMADEAPLPATNEQFSIFNENIGVLGHIDSGKTSLSKRLSEIASTASFDKNPQSQERGMTLDLGFSAFFSTIPKQWKEQEKFDRIQFTLVDCPGHASLIKTIMGGAQIINTMLLLIDATKGIQTQTAECLVIGEITAQHLIVVVNKIDLLRKPTNASLKKLITKLQLTMSKTKFPNAPIIAIAANNVEFEKQFVVDNPEIENVGIEKLIETMKSYVNEPDASLKHKPEDFLFAFDHCFPIKGQGTVITGTVLKGSVEPNQMIEFAELKEQRKVRSIQQFKRPSKRAIAGERAGICINKFDSNSVERGLVSAPNSIPLISRFIARVSKVRFFKSSVLTSTKFHISIGHVTVMGVPTFFLNADESKTSDKDFDIEKEYLFGEELVNDPQLVFIELDSPIHAPADSMLIGSRLDTEITSTTCRLSFSGQIIHVLSKEENVKLFKRKQRIGKVQRILDENNLIGHGLFDKNADINVFLGLKVRHEVSGQIGTIQSAFGKGDKFKVYFQNGIGEEAIKARNASLILDYKKMINNDSSAATSSTKQKKLQQ